MVRVDLLVPTYLVMVIWEKGFILVGVATVILTCSVWESVVHVSVLAICSITETSKSFSTVNIFIVVVCLTGTDKIDQWLLANLYIYRWLIPPTIRFCWIWKYQQLELEVNCIHMTSHVYWMMGWYLKCYEKWSNITIISWNKRFYWVGSREFIFIIFI